MHVPRAILCCMRTFRSILKCLLHDGTCTEDVLEQIRRAMTPVRLLAISCLALAAGQQSFASMVQDEPEQDMLQCAKIEDAEDRLACFDAAAKLANQKAAQKKQTPKKQVPAEPQAKKKEPAPAAKAAMGTTTGSKLEMPANTASRAKPTQLDDNQTVGEQADGDQSDGNQVEDDFGRPSEFFKPETPDVITAKVEKHWRDFHGKYFFQLENGQLWKEASGSRLRLTKKVDTVRIKKGLFGGYLITVEGSPRSGRVKRIK